MPGSPALPVAPSLGAPPNLPVGNEGQAPPVPPLGSVEIGGTSIARPRLVAGSGMTLAQSGDAIAISSTPGLASIPVGDLVPGTNDQTLATEAGTAQWSTVVSPPTVAMPALNVNWSLGYVFSRTLAGGANALTFSSQKDGQTITVAITGAASTLTFPAGVKWAGGTAPTQTASGTDVYTFVDIGGTIYGSVVQNLS